MSPDPIYDLPLRCRRGRANADGGRALRSRAEDDGAFRDIYVTGTDIDDGVRALEAVTSRWPTTYREDGEPAAMPRDIREIFRRRLERSTLLCIRLKEHLTIDVHFFEPEQIEFTFDPRDVVDDADVFRVLDFVLHVGRTVGRTVHMSIEAASDGPTDDLLYDPSSDRIVRPMTP